MQPFPTDPVGRKALHETLKAEAPELMDDVASLRALFPKARMTYVKTESVEVGIKPRDDGWQVDDALVERVQQAEVRKKFNAELAEKRRLEKRRLEASKRKRGPRK